MTRSCARLVAALFAALSIAFLVGCASPTTTGTLTPASPMLLPGQTLQFQASQQTATGTWTVNGVSGGSSTTGTITGSGVYTAPTTIPSGPVTVALQGNNGQVSVAFYDPKNPPPGAVASSNNPLVAAYSIPIPAGSSVQVQFGGDTSYGLSTSSVAAPSGGGSTTVLVAGMRASSTYHMQAIMNLANGSHLLDADKTFTTGSIPAGRIPAITGQTIGGGSPSDGVELFSLNLSASQNLLSAVATDLQGNLIWYYDMTEWPFPIKLLPNGHMLILLTPGGTTGANEIREVDLAGNLIQSITPQQVNQGLAGLVPYQIVEFHHDVLALPNGHFILLADMKPTNVQGLPAGTTVIGDVLIDWSPKVGPVWAWSAFDHLDPTRAPYGIADGVEDWTHSNAIISSPDDGNLILSMRNQNWIIKINYQNGNGDGSILWRFGLDGDFTLIGQQAPQDWNYGQHYPTIVSPNSAGVLSMMFFDNGNNRLLNSGGTICGTSGAAPCYSSVPIMQLDEYSMTATELWENDLLPAYSICCGDALLLPSGNVEFDIADDILTPGVSHIEEVTQTPTPQTIWKMDVTGQLAYRGFRIPSLYPGQKWSADALSADKSPGAAHGAGR
jgi:arylsulfate sulfotransferase